MPEFTGLEPFTTWDGAFTAQALSARLQSLLSLPDSLSKAATCARNAGIPDAGARLADLVGSVMGAAA